jgi:hypothetical protein
MRAGGLTDGDLTALRERMLAWSSEMEPAPAA